MNWIIIGGIAILLVFFVFFIFFITPMYMFMLSRMQMSGWLTAYNKLIKKKEGEKENGEEEKRKKAW